AAAIREGPRLRGASRRRSPPQSADRRGRACPCCGERAPSESRGASQVSDAARQSRALERRSLGSPSIAWLVVALLYQCRLASEDWEAATLAWPRRCGSPWLEARQCSGSSLARVCGSTTETLASAE